MTEPAGYQPSQPRRDVAVIGGGPAGLMAAEVLSAAGAAVTVFDRMPTFGRKFLMAGRGGLNLTHSEDLARFLARYGPTETLLAPAIRSFPPEGLRAWAEKLGEPTFVGSSGRVFPNSLKASPLLRAWLLRLDMRGVQFRTRCDWLGWDAAGELRFRFSDSDIGTIQPDATVLALGGASWPRLGSTGNWTEILSRQNVEISPLRPANCGFAVGWTELFRTRFAGTPLKNVALSFAGRTIRGEAVLTAYGMEGGVIYAFSAALRDAILREGSATASLDLRPDTTAAHLAERLARARPKESLSNRLRKAAGLSPPAIALLREAIGLDAPRRPEELSALIKAVPITLSAPQPLDRAISTAGGIRFDALDEHFMLKAVPGTFVAGEMLDWEAPTGGYLLQACFATGAAAARGALAWMDAR